MSQLFTPLKLRHIEFKNRIFVSPMCQYSSQNGIPNDWHFVHLGSRAVGGAGLVIAEATSVNPEGRITPDDTGIWNDQQAQGFSRITQFIKDNGARAGIQLAHAGRKASTSAPWIGDKFLNRSEGGWETVAPSAIAYNEGYSSPREMSENDIKQVIDDFYQATQRSLKAGFDVVELHMAHGYLLHQFLSPLSNKRQDQYGKNQEGRMRLPLEVAKVVREAWPSNLPVFVRISATDWSDGGWDLEQSLALCSKLKQIGIDFIDCSTGGLVPNARIPVKAGFQVPFAERIRKEIGIATGAVGLIEKPQQAENIVSSGQADAVLLAREFLRSPYWPLHAAHALGVKIDWPKQYQSGMIRD